MPKKKSKPLIRFSSREVLLIAAGFAIPFLVYVIYLDRHVVSQFEGKKFSLPAKVFARPLELYSGLRLPQKELLSELKELRYQANITVREAGQYNQDGNVITIYVRPFSFWDGPQSSQHIAVEFKKDTIKSITDVNSGSVINLARLEPLTIGGIYPNQGEDRELVRLEQVPASLIDTLVAVEDKRFYQHHGIDPKAIVRAIGTIFSDKRIQGGSTITQQLVKNFYLTQERTITRKLKEMVMAVLLELHYSKEEILETYLNEVYFGQDKNRAIHGFGLASQFYFSRGIEHLELHQAALLVGMLKGPAFYNPRKHPDRAKQRRDIVLAALHNQNVIDEHTYKSLINKKIEISALPNLGQSRYPAFMDLVIRQLKRDYRESDLRSEGLRIFTSLDPFEQHIAENSLTSRLNILERSKGLSTNHLEGAIIIVNVLDGEVKAVVGGRNSQYQGFNRALDASRQVGSLIKPAIYLTALAKSEEFNLASILDDDPFTWQEPGIQDWQPQNYDHKFHGEVPLWLALAKSYNVAAARLGTELGVDNIMNMVHRLGVDKSLPNYASGLLGTVHFTPYEVTQMYHTIASGGFRTPFRAIREVTTIEGEPLNRYNLKVEPAIPSIPNYLLVKGLQQVVEKGTGANLRSFLAKDVISAGKTGTTDDLRDSWYAGFTGDKVAVVWIGNDDNQSIQLTGATGALTVWGDMIQKMSPQPINFTTPEGIKYAAVNNVSGLLAINDCSNTFELPFNENSLPENGRYCSGKTRGKIKSWFKKLFSKN